MKLTEEKKKLELDYITEKSRAVYLETKIEQLESIKTQEPVRHQHKQLSMRFSQYILDSLPFVYTIKRSTR